MIATAVEISRSDWDSPVFSEDWVLTPSSSPKYREISDWVRFPEHHSGSEAQSLISSANLKVYSYLIFPASEAAAKTKPFISMSVKLLICNFQANYDEFY